jgi:hypothetical protein
LVAVAAVLMVAMQEAALAVRVVVLLVNKMLLHTILFGLAVLVYNLVLHLEDLVIVVDGVEMMTMTLVVVAVEAALAALEQMDPIELVE